MSTRFFRAGPLLLTALVVAAGNFAGAPGLQAQETAHGAMRSDRLAWAAAPAIFPAGAQMAVLQGDPAAEGQTFTVRLKVPNGYIVPAHWHPTDEYVTVIKGDFLIGMGDKFSKDALLPALKLGDFITVPARANHFAMAQGETIVQIQAMGPFQLTYVDPKDDPTK